MRTHLADLLIPLPPMSKPRPRGTAGQSRPYMDKNYVAWKAQARAHMGEWWVHQPLDHLNCLVVHFYGPARGDLDNRIGAVMDAGNGLLWTDDNVKVISAIASRHFRTPIKEARIYMKLVWETEQ